MVGKPNKYELDKRQTFCFIFYNTFHFTDPLLNFATQTRTREQPTLRLLTSVWVLFSVFLPAAQSISPTLAPCLAPLLWLLVTHWLTAAHDEQATRTRWRWSRMLDQWSIHSVVFCDTTPPTCRVLKMFLFFCFFFKYTNKWCWEQRLLTLKLPDVRWCKVRHSDTVLVLKWKANIFTVHGAIQPQSGSSSPNKAALAANSHCSHSDTCNLDWSLLSLSCWRVDYFFPPVTCFSPFFIFREKT